MILEPVMSEQNIGYIPSTLNRPYPPSFRDVLIADMNLYSSLPHDKPVTALNPTFNDDKSPVLKQKKVVFKGYGQPVVTTSHIEILSTQLSSPPYKAVTFTDHIIFTPNLHINSTGYFYEKKTVTFPKTITADSMALRTGVLFAFISTLLFIIKSRHKLYGWWIAFKAIKVLDGGSTTDD
ncbi:MAG: hypothetical protein P1U35_13910 [Cycloclasticus sp.]|nr:hypothetical protein [Cycloclasticus sp.]